MVVWHDMAFDPPGPKEWGKRLLLTVQPRYGPPYTDAMIWLGLSGRAWPQITHWAHMPRPAFYTEGGAHEESL